MNYSRLYHKIFCVPHWSIGFCNGSIAEIIKNKTFEFSLNWVSLKNDIISIADPFIFKDPEGNLSIVYEEFSEIDRKNYGKIKYASVNSDFNLTDEKVILDIKRHASYPFIYKENNITYIIPETSHSGKVSIFQFNFESNCLINEQVIIDNFPLLDSTIIKYNNKYWLFATKLGAHEKDYSKLYIFYADNLLDKFSPHANNPIKNQMDGSRPAGAMVIIDEELYRPVQNCALHYGASMSFNKITKLTINEFSEELHFKISPDKTSRYNAGIHTLNYIDDIIVIDGINMRFKPFTKWKSFLKKKLRKGINPTKNS